MENAMADRRVRCQIHEPKALSPVPLVNGFRPVRDRNGDWMLDFLVYSPEENKAVVVSRIRVTPNFMQAVRDRLDSTLRADRSPESVGKDSLPVPLFEFGKAN